MLKNPRTVMTLTGIALAIASMGGASAADTSQAVVDARHETQIWTTYALNPYLRATDLSVSVSGGKATLTGSVEEGVSKDLARQIALGVNGVKEVDNQIVVKPDYTPPQRSSDRSYGEAVDDATITAAVKSKLLWSKHTDGLTTDVDTKWGKVALKGTADSKADKELATRLALNTRGVVSVDNQLVVTKDNGKAKDHGKDKAPTVTGAVKTSAQEAGRDIADSWITTKVKSTFSYSSNVDGSDITVSTNGGIVTLSGKVDSGAERALAIELAKNVRGVKSVHSKGLTI